MSLECQPRCDAAVQVRWAAAHHVVSETSEGGSTLLAKSPYSMEGDYRTITTMIGAVAAETRGKEVPVMLAAVCYRILTSIFNSSPLTCEDPTKASMIPAPQSCPER